MKEILEQLTRHVASLQIECDGSSRILHLVLLRAHIAHRCMGGIVTYDDQFIPVHNWIEVDDLDTTWIIDYRLYPWLTGDLPVGVFNPEDHPALVYSGFEAEFSIRSCAAVEIATELPIPVAFAMPVAFVT